MGLARTSNCVQCVMIVAGILLGADVTWIDAVLNNLIPVTLGNLVGAAFFTRFYFPQAVPEVKSHLK